MPPQEREQLDRQEQASFPRVTQVQVVAGDTDHRTRLESFEHADAVVRMDEIVALGELGGVADAPAGKATQPAAALAAVEQLLADQHGPRFAVPDTALNAGREFQPDGAGFAGCRTRQPLHRQVLKRAGRKEGAGALEIEQHRDRQALRKPLLRVRPEFAQPAPVMAERLHPGGNLGQLQVVTAEGHDLPVSQQAEQSCGRLLAQHARVQFGRIQEHGARQVREQEGIPGFGTFGFPFVRYRQQAQLPACHLTPTALDGFQLIAEELQPQLLR